MITAISHTKPDTLGDTN